MKFLKKYLVINDLGKENIKAPLNIEFFWISWMERNATPDCIPYKPPKKI
jgi:hypothetical protein